MRISIVAGSRPFPVGGVLSRYEYANRLCRRGHEVHLVHFSWAYEAVAGLDDLDWFTFEDGVEHHFGVSGDPELLPSADVVSDPYLHPHHGLPFQFLQGVQPFRKDALERLYRAPGPKVCVARWLVEEARRNGVDRRRLVHIPDGLDHQRFRIVRPIEARGPRVAMLYHRASYKGTRFGIEALERARDRVPDLEAVLFGAQVPTTAIPGWMTVVREPSPEVLVEEVYNAASVFLVPAMFGEGFGLSSLEAMACGCALVTTANGGSADYAFDGETAMVCSPRDVVAMADHVVALLGDDAARVELARQGAAFVRRFDWDASAAALEEFLERYRSEPGQFLEDAARR